ncbi:phosphoserine phosphatase SerB [Helicobacter ailurogastricus]|uniref:Phosphoserine phosphatase n=1 Tax=Helicobacter ailurogastricus TaxID=1578720 RepID=A0A0K2Y0J7_9HELI|nr:phosphoserine phosphatase SerB [Helicobacter ailurogastricus]BDQ28286.1 phosphoserine phosphatase SerB [Helicobacter ailurogastricus]CRF52821.1 Phosphoserine phosphatase [Helicobacter ailurogastricus]
MKLAVFDFDSTLVDAETIEVLAQNYGVGQAVENATELAMAGKADFYTSLLSRASLLKGMDAMWAEAICQNLPLHLGALEVVQGLHALGYKVVCLSGGFKWATGYFKEKLGLDADFSNTLHVRDGFLTGQVSGPLMRGDSKAEILASLQSLLKPKHTLAIGDGANDIGMFKLADLSVAFNAKEITKKAATFVAQSLDLREILNYLKA